MCVKWAWKDFFFKACLATRQLVRARWAKVLTRFRSQILAVSQMIILAQEKEENETVRIFFERKIIPGFSWLSRGNAGCQLLIGFPFSSSYFQFEKTFFALVLPDDIFLPPSWSRERDRQLWLFSWLLPCIFVTTCPAGSFPVFERSRCDNDIFAEDIMDVKGTRSVVRERRDSANENSTAQQASRAKSWERTSQEHELWIMKRPPRRNLHRAIK